MRFKNPENRVISGFRVPIDFGVETPKSLEIPKSPEITPFSGSFQGGPKWSTTGYHGESEGPRYAPRTPKIRASFSVMKTHFGISTQNGPKEGNLGGRPGTQNRSKPRNTRFRRYPKNGVPTKSPDFSRNRGFHHIVTR